MTQHSAVEFDRTPKTRENQTMNHSTNFGAAPFAAQPITNRDFWQSVREDARLAAYLDGLAALAEAAPEVPPRPLASDYLAAKRNNDRSILDRYWQNTRSTLTALAMQRALRGLEDDDADDRLLNWLWAALHEPTWTVSAHLPGNDLPASGEPVLDLASCEMALNFAEMREVMKPWLDSVSDTLADSMLWEIDTRILTPYGEGLEVWWQSSRERCNNWVGVCAGSILAACESLAAQGHPRPKARARALEGLRFFFDDAFTTNGECDEGLSYWSYGVGMACLGLSRLSRAEMETTIDMQRLAQIADYPRRAHLFDDFYFSANDATLRFKIPQSTFRWLAATTGNSWLGAHAASALEAPKGKILFSQALRVLQSPDWTMPPHQSDAQNIGTQWIPDQQAAIFRADTPRGELLATLSGGDNAERHNHNDVGHFNIALDKQWIVIDMGAPAYAADFFGPNRYNYLPASSRGHCCPLIDEIEQRDGHDAAANIVAWSPEEAHLKLEMSAAYPPAAGLQSWTRSLQSRGAQMLISDDFTTQRAAQSVTHVLWTLCEPQQLGDENGVLRFQLGPLSCEISPAPATWNVVEYSPEALRLREFGGQTLYCLHANYVTDESAQLHLKTDFSVR